MIFNAPLLGGTPHNSTCHLRVLSSRKAQSKRARACCIASRRLEEVGSHACASSDRLRCRLALRGGATARADPQLRPPLPPLLVLLAGFRRAAWAEKQRCSTSVDKVAAKAAGEGKLRLRAGLRPASRAARGTAPVCSACKLSRCGSVASCPPGCPECGMCGDVPAAGGCCSGARCGGRVRGCACVAAECAAVRMRLRMRA